MCRRSVPRTQYGPRKRLDCRLGGTFLLGKAPPWWAQLEPCIGKLKPKMGEAPICVRSHKEVYLKPLNQHHVRSVTIQSEGGPGGVFLTGWAGQSPLLISSGGFSNQLEISRLEFSRRVLLSLYIHQCACWRWNFRFRVGFVSKYIQKKLEPHALVVDKRSTYSEGIDVRVDQV